ncbi:MAG: hypothetical protein IT317_03225 [Anaerolineales bacterium]|nr:hypothetical protein [Anaerolineales bacterium]
MNNSLQGLTNFAKQRPWLVAGIALALGFFVGWWGMGWGLWPIDYVDGAPAQLRADYQQDYVRLVAAEYALSPNQERAAARIKELGGNAADIVAATLAASQGEDALRVGQLQQVLQLSGAFNPTPGGNGAAAEPSLWEQYRLPLLGCTLLGLLVLAAGAAWYLWSSGLLTRGRAAGAGAGAGAAAPVRTAGTTTRPTGAAARAAARAAAASAPTVTDMRATPTGGPPVAQFMTTYVLGDDLYDDSFSIDAPDGSFLGECGLGISETIGVGDPKKVMAFEVWLFDKNDIRTVTKVLMSEHAFRDEALKSRLAAKGEPVLVTSGDVVSMETASLVVTARVVDMAYGGGALPPSSFFERLTIELAAYTKAAA